MGNGFPANNLTEDYTDEDWEKEFKKWHKDLLKAADDIDQHEVATDWSNYKDMEKAVKRVERGLDFVKKNFFSLWD